MSKSHFIAPAAVAEDAITVRLGTTGAKLLPIDANKLVKLIAESNYDLCAAGDPIEGIVSSVDTATSGGFSVGGIFKGRNSNGTIFVIADGLQATPGTGTIAVGDYVVCGTVTAKGTALAAGLPKVCKATVQFGAVPADLTAAAAQIKASLFAWRVESLGTVGTGAVGTQITIVRV